MEMVFSYNRARKIRLGSIKIFYSFIFCFLVIKKCFRIRNIFIKVYMGFLRYFQVKIN
jgi:hypothetical protein